MSTLTPILTASLSPVCRAAKAAVDLAVVAKDAAFEAMRLARRHEDETRERYALTRSEWDLHRHGRAVLLTFEVTARAAAAVGAVDEAQQALARAVAEAMG